MKNISLLPAELKNYQASAKNISRFAVIISILILAFVLIYTVLSLSAVIPEQELASVREQREEIRQKAEELKPYEDMANTAGTVEKLISDAMGTNPRWSSLFVRVFNSIPDRVWLNDFNVTYKDDAGEMSIKGRADSHTYVADWLSALKTVDGLSDIKCQFTAKSDTGSGGDTVQFEIRTSLVRGGGPETKDGEGKSNG